MIWKTIRVSTSMDHGTISTFFQDSLNNLYLHIFGSQFNCKIMFCNYMLSEITFIFI